MGGAEDFRFLFLLRFFLVGAVGVFGVVWEEEEEEGLCSEEGVLEEGDTKRLALRSLTSSRSLTTSRRS